MEYGHISGSGNDFVTMNDLDELKNSIEMAHHANRVNHTQVSDCIRDLKYAMRRIDSLELEMKNLRNYTSELEDYCISLDTTIRNHHVLISRMTEYGDEMINLVAFRILQICFAELEVSDIDYAYRIGFNPLGNDGILVFVSDTVRGA